LSGPRAGPLRGLGGTDPEGGEVQVMPGRYGPYIKWGKVNATLPKELTPEAVTLEEALALVAEKAGKSGGKKKAAPKRAAAAKTAAPKKTAPKKVAAKKAPAKKKATPLA
ncbi:MAG: DNA topoisomerase I, partial [Rhodobacteraceae bacterium]|nr:DNA topoisomerase I [Paracoccaceae bacterium]